MMTKTPIIRLLFIVLLVIAVCSGHPALATNIYWGDIHAHSAYSTDANNMSGIESGNTLDDFFTYASDIANLDFVAITDHAENISTSVLNAMVANALSYDNTNNPEFIPFVGYEWTNKPYGHRTVLFKELEPNHPLYPSNNEGVRDIQDLWSNLTNDGYSGLAFTLPHHPAATMPANVDWSYHDTNYQPLVEIYSEHGNSESCDSGTYNPLTNPDPASACVYRSTVQQALDRGLKLGIYAGTDSHDTRPGSVDDLDLCRTGQAYKGGLMAVMASSLTRDNIWSAIKNRRVYGTSGPRIELQFQINGQDMGSTVDINHLEPVMIEVTVVPDGGIIKWIKIIRNGSEIATFDWTRSCSYVEMPSPFNSYYYVRVLQITTCFPYLKCLDMAWSSPIWINPVPVAPAPLLLWSNDVYGYPDPLEELTKGIMMNRMDLERTRVDDFIDKQKLHYRILQDQF